MAAPAALTHQRIPADLKFSFHKMKRIRIMVATSRYGSCPRGRSPTSRRWRPRPRWRRRRTTLGTRRTSTRTPGSLLTTSPLPWVCLYDYAEFSSSFLKLCIRNAKLNKNCKTEYLKCSWNYIFCPVSIRRVLTVKVSAIQTFWVISNWFPFIRILQTWPWISHSIAMHCNVWEGVEYLKYDPVPKVLCLLSIWIFYIFIFQQRNVFCIHEHWIVNDAERGDSLSSLNPNSTLLYRQCPPFTLIFQMSSWARKEIHPQMTWHLDILILGKWNLHIDTTQIISFLSLASLHTHMGWVWACLL